MPLPLGFILMLATPDIASELRCALDPVAFAIERLNFEPDPWQVEVLRSSAPRLALNCSRQVGKSTTAAIKCTHRAVYHPRSLILLVSPSLRQSRELFGKVTDFLKMLDTKPALDEDNALSLALETGSRVVCLPGNAATVRGYSAPSLVIEDEAAYCPDSLYRSIRPMLAVSKGQLILLSTPYGKRGHFFKEWEGGGDEWGRFKITADDCPRIDAEFLKQERRSLGERWFRQEYYCEFADVIDTVFRLGDVERSISSDVTPLFKTPPHGDDVRPLSVA